MTHGVPMRSGDRPNAVGAHLGAGRLHQALQHADALLGEPLVEGQRNRVAGLRGLALSLVGRTEEALAALAEAAAASAFAGAGRAAILSCWAEAALWSGLPREAIGRAAAALEAEGDDEAVVRAVLARAWAEHELDREHFVVAMDVLASRGLAGVAAQSELRALAASTTGSWLAAAADFSEAAARWDARNAPRALLCRWAAAEARRRAGDRGAAATLRAVLEAATAMGFEPLAARVRRSLRLAGFRPPLPRAPRSDDRTGRQLTGRERQVLDLVERGRTNGEIARRMGLGRPTVARLLSNAMVKLGAESRAHAIAIHACAGGGASLATVPGGGCAGEIHDDARSILARIAAGGTLGAVAAELGLSRRTADRRLADARAALGAERTTEAVARAQRLGWLA